MFCYFKKQSLGGQPVNSAYLGLGGMSNDLMFGGRQYGNTSVSGLIAGYSFALSPTIQLSPEGMWPLMKTANSGPQWEYH
ncbi:hypothetical protein LQ318_04160 [Aliifodinibius salicampi]|uniref:Uncharacterized protein n=1 Tax=Fodinibius salicampi TaxID=1920655 RepID=A0ABT3PW56_9BACT|nr:hypothetical protein [Fodinibius salicampi]MCW9712092.1 hypothetical protein [Fodinibius salicampi]